MRQLLLLALCAASAQALHMIAPLNLPREFLEQQPMTPATGAPCDSFRLNYCQQTFDQMIGVPGDVSQDWNDPTNMLVTLRALYQTLDGLLQVCQARTTFQQCLGPMYNTCIDKLRFIKNGVDLTAASTFVELFNELEFDCDGGFIQAGQKWDCIIKNEVIFNGSLLKCQNDFINETTGHQENICSSAQKMLFCARAPYYAQCGPDVGWWECERVRRTFSVDVYCPQLTCTFSLLGSSSSYTLEDAKQLHARLAAEEEIEKMRNKKFKSASGHRHLSRAEMFRSMANMQLVPQHLVNHYAELGMKAKAKGFN